MEENDDPRTKTSSAWQTGDDGTGQCSKVVLHNIVLHRNPKTSSAWQTGDDGGGRLSGKRASREAATGAN